MNNPPDFIHQFWRTVWRWIIHFREPVYSSGPPLRKKSEKGCLWGRGRLYTGESQTNNPFLALVWKRPMKKVPVSGTSVFNDSEGLYRTTVCRWLVRRPHHSARLMRFGSSGPREFATEMPWLRLRGIKAVQGLGMAMSTRSVGGKQEIAVYQQHVLQTVIALRVVSLVFSNNNPQ